MARESVAYRLRAVGDDTIKNSFREIADSGDQSAKRVAAAYDRDLKQAEGAIERLERRAKQLDGLGSSNVQRFINGNTGADDRNFRSAQQSASALVREQDQLIRQKQTLLSQFDPLVAAQGRYNSVIEQASNLRRREIITEEQFIQVQSRAQQALQDVAEGTDGAGRSVGAFRYGIQNAGFQVSDFAVQVGAGTSATRAFALQGPQLIQAVAMMGNGAETSSGKFAKFANFISGPWGAALTVGVSIMGAFMTQMESSDKASEDLTDSLDFQKMSTDELTKAIRDQRREAEQSIQTSYQAEQQAYATARANVAQAQSERQKLQALLETAREEYARAENPAMGTASSSAEAASFIGSAASNLRTVEARLAENAQQISTLEATLRDREISVLDRRVSAMTDPTRAASLRDEDRQADLRRQRSQNQITQAEYVRQSAESIRLRDAETEAIRKQNAERNKAPSKAEKPITNGEVRGVLEGLGVNITSGTRSAAQNAAVGGARNSYHVAGQAFDLGLVDGQGRRLSKEIIHDALTAAGVEIKELLGPGDKGHSDHFHVAFSKDRLNSDQRLEASLKSQQEAEELALKTEEDRLKLRDMLIGSYAPEIAQAEALAEQMRKIDEGVANGSISAEQGTEFKRTARASNFMLGLNDNLAGLRETDAATGERQADYRKTVDDLGGQQQTELAYLDRELSLVTANADERERQLAALDFIAELTRRNIDAASDEGRALIEGNTAITERNLLLRDQADAWRETTQFGERMIDTVLDPQNWRDFGDLGKSILQDLQQEFIRMAAINPLKNMLFGSGLPTMFGGAGGGGGVFDFLGGLIGGKAPGSAVGSENWGGGYTWLAENGPELVNLPAGSRITPAAQTRRMMQANDNAPSIHMPITIDATGADAAGLARVEARLVEMQRELPATIISTVVEGRQRFVL